MLTTRQYLRALPKDKLEKLFKLTNLNNTEYWLLRYAFIEKRMRDNICMKLNIRKTKYHSILNEALIKVDFILNNLDKVRTL